MIESGIPIFCTHIWINGNQAPEHTPNVTNPSIQLLVRSPYICGYNKAEHFFLQVYLIVKTHHNRYISGWINSFNYVGGGECIINAE